MSKQSYPVLTLTILAATTIIANRFFQADGTPAGVQENAIGVSRTAGSSGDAIPVDVLGTAIVEAGGTVTAGGTVQSDSTGRAVDWTSGGAKIAIALQGTTTAGDFVEVLLIPNAA